MTMIQLSVEYRSSAGRLKHRIGQLRLIRQRTPNREACLHLDERIRVLTIMWRETRDLAVLTERYYDRGYWRNVKYTV